MHSALSILELSHIPIIAFFIYSFCFDPSLFNSKRELFYWKGLRALSIIASLIYIILLLNCILSSIGLVKNIKPNISLKEEETFVAKIKSQNNEAELLNIKKKFYDEDQILSTKEGKINIQELKTGIIEKGVKAIREKNQEIILNAKKRIASLRMNAVKYVSMSLLYTIIYAYFAIFFHRLCKSKWA
jgi:hypothetical protein